MQIPRPITKGSALLGLEQGPDVYTLNENPASQGTTLLKHWIPGMLEKMLRATVRISRSKMSERGKGRRDGEGDKAGVFGAWSISARHSPFRFVPRPVGSSPSASDG